MPIFLVKMDIPLLSFVSFYYIIVLYGLPLRENSTSRYIHGFGEEAEGANWKHIQNMEGRYKSHEIWLF